MCFIYICFTPVDHTCCQVCVLALKLLVHSKFKYYYVLLLNFLTAPLGLQLSDYHNMDSSEPVLFGKRTNFMNE